MPGSPTSPADITKTTTKTVNVTPAPEPVWYQGNCHCGAVRFEFKITPLYATDGAMDSDDEEEEAKHEVTACNCSICLKNGFLSVYPDYPANFQITHGRELLKGYQFGNKSVIHRFCGNCGSSCMVEMNFGGIEKVSVNARMIQNINVDKLRTKKFDGWNILKPRYEAPS